MKIYPPFPTCREATPTRRAEKLIYETLEASELDGLALYEVKPLSSAPQLDFAVWILDVGTFGIQTKGGRYIMIDGEWHLVTDRGRIRKESPIPGTWDAAMAIHDWVQEQLRHKTFVIPVLVLTDMEPDAEIEALAAARNVAVHWGSPDNLVEHLVELAAERKVYVRPTSAGIAAEAELVLPGSTRAVRTTEPLAAPAHQVHIHVAGPGGKCPCTRPTAVVRPITPERFQGPHRIPLGVVLELEHVLAHHQRFEVRPLAFPLRQTPVDFPGHPVDRFPDAD